MRTRHRIRSAANVVNLSTPAGLLLARLAAGPPRRSRDGLLVSHGYRMAIPPAPAFTLGNVVFLRSAGPRGADPVGSIPVALLQHEERHATQYALCGGVLMPLLYVGAAGWSWWRTGDFGSANPFERWAGLADGGYRRRPARPSREAATEVRALVRRRAGTA